MAKEDVEDQMPSRPPSKRRTLEAAPDVWLAKWLASDLSPGERKRVQAVRDTRKAKHPDVTIAVLADRHVGDKAQLDAFRDQLNAIRHTRVLHGGLPKKFHEACRRNGVKVERMTVHDVRELLRDAQEVIALPYTEQVMPYATPGTWSEIGLAKHRSLPVRVILRSGQVVT